MKELTIEQAKKIQLHVLKCFHELCNRTGLRYSLYAGTLIGALRHRGYIPWDDDVDVAMPREDYEKFLRIFSKIDHPDYLELYDSRTHSGYGFPFMKLADKRTLQTFVGKEVPGIQLGLHIDIFAIDGMPQSKFLATIYLRLMRFIRHCCEMSLLHTGVKGRSLIKRFAVVMFKVCTLGSRPSFWHRLHNWLAMRYPLKGSRWGGDVVWGYVERELVPIECYEETQEVFFEGYRFLAFGDSDTYLRCVYGDYMTPPPPHLQRGGHMATSYQLVDMDESSYD